MYENILLPTPPPSWNGQTGSGATVTRKGLGVELCSVYSQMAKFEWQNNMKLKVNTVS